MEVPHPQGKNNTGGMWNWKVAPENKNLIFGLPTPPWMKGILICLGSNRGCRHCSGQCKCKDSMNCDCEVQLCNNCVESIQLEIVLLFFIVIAWSEMHQKYHSLPSSLVLGMAWQSLEVDWTFKFNMKMILLCGTYPICIWKCPTPMEKITRGGGGGLWAILPLKIAIDCNVKACSMLQI